MNSYNKKLIEVALPLEAINAASARENWMRHGRPSALERWWARRPLAPLLAIILTAMVQELSIHFHLFSAEKTWAESDTPYRGEACQAGMTPPSSCVRAACLLSSTNL